MQERNVVPHQYTRKLKELANMFISREYFNSFGPDKQQEYYRKWRAENSLKDVISGPERTLIECVGPGEYEIVDGWGRLLPFAALLQQRYRFYPVESFVAWRRCDDPYPLT
jgi:hypothetical protein